MISEFRGNLMIYLDYNSTYPCKKEHVESVFKKLIGADGNPANTHWLGRKARIVLDEARVQVARLFGAPKDRVIFNSCGTEGNNSVLMSTVAFQDKDHPIKIIVSSGEHPSVKDCAHFLAKSEKHISLYLVQTTKDGFIDTEDLYQAVDQDTAIVCLIHANNETGVVNDMATIAANIKKKNPKTIVHIDAVQSLGKLDLTWLEESCVDSASFSSHKIGGLKGAGCLYKKATFMLHPLLYGGGQEQGLRSGTHNLSGIISFGERAREIMENPSWLAEGKKVARYTLQKLTQISGIEVHGDMEKNAGTTLNFHINHIPKEEILLTTDMANIAISGGSACASGLKKPSQVLLSMGYSEWVAQNSVRASFGAESTYEEADQLIACLAALAKKA